jgi:hypothetical protein
MFHITSLSGRYQFLMEMKEIKLEKIKDLYRVRDAITVY